MTNYYKRCKIKSSDFKESEHPRDADGKFTVKGKQSKRKAILDLLRKKRAKINLQFFADKSGDNSYSDFQMPKELPKKASGFKDKKSLTTPDHLRHMQELGYKTPKEYEQGAIDFWEKTDGDIYFGHQRKRFYKYNSKLNLMLVISPDGTIHTFYRVTEKKFKKIIIQERMQIWKK